MADQNDAENVVEQAEDDFATDEARIFHISVEDQRTFAEAILNPSPPPLGLRRAFDAYRKLIKESR